MKKENKYSEITNSSQIKFDSRQREIIKELSDWSEVVEAGQKKDETLSIKKLFTKKNAHYKSIYLYGAVGSGKSLICHLVFSNIDIDKKQYFHFHEFMRLVHNKLFKFREAKQLSSDGLIKHLAQEFAENTILLYLDEMVINDIADAMIIGKLISELVKNGVTMIITSNFRPEELYKDGIQRQTFLATTEVFGKSFDILNLSADIDYRYLKSLSLESFYLAQNKEEERSVVKSLIEKLEVGKFESRELEVNGRKFISPSSYKNLALFDFDELFGFPLSYADYLVLCENFNIIIISGVRRLMSEEMNETRRLINFIDTAYDKKIKLIVVSSCELGELYNKGTLKDEFKRSLSRLNEML